MKKFLSTILVVLFLSQVVYAFSVDTTDWACIPEHFDIVATEIDLKNDYRLFQTTIKNISSNELSVVLPSNQNVEQVVSDILNSGLKVKELLDLPKQIAVDCYNEDVGVGKVATAHKSLINVLGTAGSVAAGVGMLGIYPQQKYEEYVSHKKIKKEFKKYKGDIIGDFIISPNSSQEILLFVPINGTGCLIDSKVKENSSEVYSDFHQL